MTEITTPRKGLYLCRRTSCCSDDAPCEDAFRISVVTTDTGSVSDPADIAYYKGETKWWYEKGTNHRVEDGRIKRDMGVREEWAVYIDSISDFIDKYGECVVDKDGNGFYTIEIYDADRE